MASPKSLTNQLRRLRKQAGYRQKDVARILGCSEFEVIRHERGTLPTLKNAIKLELLYDLPIRTLFAPFYQTLQREVRRRQRRLKLSWPVVGPIDFSLPRRGRRVLALDPWTKAIGMACLQGEQLLDCRVRYLDGPLPDRLRRKGVVFVKEILRLYRPQVLVLPGMKSYPGRTRSRHVRRFCSMLKSLAARIDCRVVESEAGKVSLIAAGKMQMSRHAIALAVATRFPELRHHVPPPRKPWQSQDLRTSAFYAVALALAGRGNRGGRARRADMVKARKYR